MEASQQADKITIEDFSFQLEVILTFTWHEDASLMPVGTSFEQQQKHRRCLPSIPKDVSKEVAMSHDLCLVLLTYFTGKGFQGLLGFLPQGKSILRGGTTAKLRLFARPVFSWLLGIREAMEDLSPGAIPSGVILVTKGATAEQVLFAFPYTRAIPDPFVLINERPNENAETEGNPTAPPEEDESESPHDEDTVECSDEEEDESLSDTNSSEGESPSDMNGTVEPETGLQSEQNCEDDRSSVSDDETPEEDKPMLITTIEYKKERPSESVQFGISTPMLAYLLASSVERPLEVKVDNIRFAGYPKKIESLSQEYSVLPQFVSVIFVLPASAPAHIVESFQNLSRLVAAAVNFEQTRCHYFQKEVLIMQKVHDEIDAHQHDGKAPFEVILNRSQLAQTLREIYDDLREYGMVNAFIDGFVEVGFCLETQALHHAGLPPKSRQDLEAAIRKIRPYHGIILLEETIPSPDANPALKLFLKHCEPDKSLIGISLACGLPLIQVLMVVRHLILWGRAIVIFPLSGSNIYSSATDRQLPPNGELTDQYKEYFPNFHLADILAHFTPPTTLSTFLENTNNDASKKNERTNIICRLLRDQLIMQLHTFIYLMPPFQSGSKEQKGISEALPPEVVERINVVLKRIEEVSPFAEYIGLFQEKLYSCCKVLMYSSTTDEVLSALDVFYDLIHYLNGAHHIEDIMFRTNRERGDVVRVLDTFSPLTSSLCRPDFLCSD
uniref:GATOR complex protein NPRL3 n=1 Tax=Steinernema glaseri TaxID=37863 RepID=A0A1I7YDU9_9BILA